MLSGLLYKASGKQVYIFLDEYDTPIHDAYIEGYYKECTQFLAKLFGNTFKGNPYLAKAMITGILKVGKASLFSDLNNVVVYSMLDDERYHSFFGFTPSEVDELLAKAHLPNNIPGLKEMYNGYEVHGTTLYNPWSMVNFITKASARPTDQITQAMKPYWVNTGGTRIIEDLLNNNLLDVEEDITALVQGYSIESYVDEEVHFDPCIKTVKIPPFNGFKAYKHRLVLPLILHSLCMFANLEPIKESFCFDAIDFARKKVLEHGKIQRLAKAAWTCNERYGSIYT